jgi:hypothetical protein
MPTGASSNAIKKFQDQLSMTIKLSKLSLVSVFVKDVDTADIFDLMKFVSFPANIPSLDLK